LKYPKLDERIQKTYAAYSTATNKNSLYASEIKALRWASDRIGEEGVVAFVTNGSFIDGNTADGLRKCLTQEFSHLYVFNLRGNQRTSGEVSRREGGKIFGEGSRNTVTIVLMVKDPKHQGACALHYHDIGDYLSREEKLAIIAQLGSIEALDRGMDLGDGHGLRRWQMLTPNAAGDWINQRNPEFEGFVALNDDPKAIFSARTRGVETSRDDWVYNFSRAAVAENMRRMIDFYNSQVVAFGEQCRAAGKDAEKVAQRLIDTDPKKIKWTRGLIGHLSHARVAEFSDDKIGIGLYRPFSKAWLYYDRQFNEYFKEKLFPSTRHPNLAISVTGVGVSKDFACLIVDAVPDVQLLANGQCFPLYVYEKPAEAKSSHGKLFAEDSAQADTEGYVRRDAITDAALADYRAAYADGAITKEDLFYHVYGILHAPDYRQKFAADLRKMLPRIPRPKTKEDFWAFSRAGRELAELHLHYETIDPYPLQEILTSTVEDWRVVKMRYPSKTDKTRIIYNAHLTLSGIPPEALEYVVNGKPAIEWIMERYQVTTDKDSGILNDPNAWCEEQGSPRYIVDLIKRVVRVSVETVRIVKSLPAVV
jgi:predicted helicase